jgi:hypothetical protein
MDTASGFASIHDGIKNEYNKVEQENVMREMKGCGHLDDMMHVGMGNGNKRHHSDIQDGRRSLARCYGE